MSESSPVSSVEHLPSAVVIRVLTPELRAGEVDALCGEVDAAVAVAPPSLPFILDMAQVRFAGSLALGMLVGLNQEFRTRRQQLVFASFQARVRESIEVAHVNRIVEIMPDVPTALRSIGGAMPDDAAIR